MKPLKSYWQLSSFYYFYCFALGAWVPYWPLYMQSIGYGAMAIGMTSACFNASRIIAPNLWGYLADHYGHRLLLIRMGCLLSLLCFSMILLSKSLWALCLIMFSFSFFWTAVIPQFEVLTLNKLRSKVVGYGRIRLWGSIGFIASVLLLGWLYDWVDIQWFPWIMIISLLFMCVSVFLVRRDARIKLSESDTMGFKSQFRQWRFWGFLVMVLLMQICFAPYYNFFSIFLNQQGYSSTMIGLLWTIGIVSEIILFHYIGSLLSRISIKLLILISIFLTAIRWLCFPLFPDNLLVLVIVQFFHAFGFGAFHTCVLEYVRQQFPPRQQGRGQAVVNSVGFGVGAMLGAIISGMLWDTLEQNLYFYASTCALLALLIAIVCVPKLNNDKDSNLTINAH